MTMNPDDLDPRWEWHELRRLSGSVTYHRGRCLHGDVVPCESVTGEVVAHLCLTCDAQLSAHWQRGDPDPPIEVPRNPDYSGR